MEVLIYQVVIAVLILVAGAFGKKSRNIITFIICLFTVVEIFTFKLAILQFITIFLAYAFSSRYEERKVEEKKEEFNYYVVDKKKKEKSESSFGSFSVFFIIVISIFSTIYIFQRRNELKKESIGIKNDSLIYKKNTRIYKPVIDTVINDNSIVEDVVIKNSDITTVNEEDVFSSDKNMLEYTKDEKNDIEYCNHTNLSYKYDYKIFIKKSLNKNHDLIIEKIIVSVINKSTNLEKQNIVLKKENNKDYFNFYDDYSNCNFVVSYITGINSNKEFGDYNYGDFIVGDFNFDSKEDFAVKINNSNLGAAYFFYIMGNDGKFSKSNFPIMHIPTKMDLKNKTITNSYNLGCCEGYDDVFKYIKNEDKWVLIKSTHIKYK